MVMRLLLLVIAVNSIAPHSPYLVTIVTSATFSASTTCLQAALRINSPVIIYYDKSTALKFIQRIRYGMPTRFFNTQHERKKYTRHLSHFKYRTNITWIKMLLLQRAILANPFKTHWFLWLDIDDSCTPDSYATALRLVWPNPASIAILPTSKIITAAASFIVYHSLLDELLIGIQRTLKNHHNAHDSDITTIFRILHDNKPLFFHAPPLNSVGDLFSYLGYGRYKIPTSVSLSFDILTSATIYSSFGVVTMISSSLYISGANALYASLLANMDASLLPRISFVALVIKGRDNKDIYTKLIGWELVEVPAIAPPFQGAFTNVRFLDQFTKFHLWNMVAFERILYLDSDTLCVRDISRMLVLPKTPFAAVYDWENGEIQAHFNMGVFSITPNHTEFLFLDSKRQSERGYRLQMAEQGLINYLYANATIDIFSFEYNGNLAAAHQNPAYWNENYLSLRIIHYTWIKPFDKKRTKRRNCSACRGAIEVWDEWMLRAE
jgi:hypothetical protein